MTRRSAKATAGISTYVIGKDKARGALRLGTVRHLPRGVRREDRGDYFDVWLPSLAPSRQLLRWWLDGEPTEARFRIFTKRYRREMASSEPRGTIALLAAAARRMPVAIGCYCDRPQCHRVLLEELVRNEMD
jgi:uncharacterized protein YeaO (DUF488 family)